MIAAALVLGMGPHHRGDDAAVNISERNAAPPSRDRGFATLAPRLPALREQRDVASRMEDAVDLSGQRFECFALFVEIVVMAIDRPNTGNGVPYCPLGMIGLYPGTAH